MQHVQSAFYTILHFDGMEVYRRFIHTVIHNEHGKDPRDSEAHDSLSASIDIERKLGQDDLTFSFCPSVQSIHAIALEICCCFGSPLSSHHPERS